MGTKPGLLITGASHTGKSTLARLIRDRMGWSVFATDTMSRHPGRPWPDPPSHVGAFYRALDANTIDTLVRHHHENMWPLHKDLLLQERQFIFEGTALRPELIADLKHTLMIAVLIAPEGVLRNRIITSAGPDADEALVQAFAERAERENAAFAAAARGHALTVYEATNMPEVCGAIHAQLIASQRA